MNLNRSQGLDIICILQQQFTEISPSATTNPPLCKIAIILSTQNIDAQQENIYIYSCNSIPEHFPHRLIAFHSE